MSVHIVTMGISLASNYERDTREQRVREIEIEEKVSKMIIAQRSEYSKQLTKYIKEKDKAGRIAEASAELNGLSHYLNEISLIYLISSDTALAKACTTAVKTYLEGRGIQVAEPIEIQGLGRPETFQTGLANLVKQMAEILIHHKDTRICATGGFKPEVALASILGFIAKAPVYYIHESFRTEIHLPALPLKWRLEGGKHRNVIKALINAGEEGVDKQEIEKKYGREVCRALIQNWLVEEKSGRYTTTDVSRQILKAIIELAGH